MDFISDNVSGKSFKYRSMQNYYICLMQHPLHIPYTIILGSRSPRRHQLLSGIDLSFQVMIKETSEDFPSDMHPKNVAEYLCQKKAAAFETELADHPNWLVITADTLVAIHDTILNKPQDEEEAYRMLQTLSGNMHTVYTGVCLRTSEKNICFSSATRVHFRTLLDADIKYYIQHYKPYDKAGSYGAQDWIGLRAIQQIEGCYYNVMGLPVSELYEQLSKLGENTSSI